VGLRSFVALALLCALGLVPRAAGAETPPTPVSSDALMSTIAGNGLPGLRDGAALEAEFLEPSGLAVGRGGDLFVTDAAGQRIRRIDSRGIVSTVAGSGRLDASGLFVPGGFRDGPAAQAQFDHPTGIVQAPDGALLVADMLNHCVRRIADGVVTTYAGNAHEPGNADGSLTSARFDSPMGLAFDRAGNLYVADFHNGARKIDVAGHVTTIILPNGRGLHATAVATAVEGGHDILLVALESGVTRIDLTAGFTSFYVAGMRAPGPFHDTADDLAMEGGTDLGAVYAIAPFGDDRFVYTDVRNHSVHIIWGRQARILAGATDMYAAYNGAGYRDGPGPQTRLDAPLGIVRTGGDRFAIADAGNRRIRSLVVHTAPEETFQDLAAAKNVYRIAYIGNSYVDYQGDDHTSIAVLLQTELRERAAALGIPKQPRVFTFRLLADAPAIGSYVRNYFPGTADLVIWQVNAGELSIPGGIGAETASRVDLWRPMLQHELRESRDALAADHTQFLAVLNPMPWEVSPIEGAYQRIYDLPVPAYETAMTDAALLRDAMAHAGVDVVDLFPAFQAEERSAERPALFSAYDHHLSEAGRRLLAQSIASALARLKPWKAAR
jgi:hypothetical protein